MRVAVGGVGDGDRDLPAERPRESLGTERLEALSGPSGGTTVRSTFGSFTPGSSIVGASPFGRLTVTSAR
ncbi:hypothetical protein [Tessaracoccus coleopterorum]|uniref:hypothetical protein n=1 Tax=Tessaracoccus coleopterorum TaxID=2714950 RepID=UPI001E3A7267|nr:hypothetical protein [Tessaracoccus coleopterorum]